MSSEARRGFVLACTTVSGGNRTADAVPADAAVESVDDQRIHSDKIAPPSATTNWISS